MGQDMSRSATPERDLHSDLHSLFSDDELDLDNFDLEGFTQEEAVRYNEIAEHGQRLQDALVPKKVAASIQKVPKRIRNSHTKPSVIKQMNHYIRKHPFFERSLAITVKSERRQFERNVYDFARGLGLKRTEARRHVIKAREFCGEEQSDSDSSSFEGEIDDSRWMFETSSNLDESAAEAMPIDLPTRQVDSSDKTRTASDIPTKVGKDAVSMSAGTKPPSKKRKAKAGGMDSDYQSASPLELLELYNRVTALQAGDKPDEGKGARRDSKKKRKRQKRLEISKDDKTEPEVGTNFRRTKRWRNHP
ncbi:hypothetical protein JMJ35_000960 [Cladonia borealis]|uniref:Uncharacterized protein n=1 Tax=Cladonia borealis TaxID=184061 RepID=A0AA39V515_9LECA|nr:hypothetical protein JMJ35_000960 [Cladonia borealis]